MYQSEVSASIKRLKTPQKRRTRLKTYGKLSLLSFLHDINILDQKVQTPVFMKRLSRSLDSSREWSRRYEIQLMFSMRSHDASNILDGPPVLRLPDHVNDASAINAHNQKAGIMREQNRMH